MFEKFSDRARKVMALANQEAQGFNHEYIGTEHILLGLVKLGNGVGVEIIKQCGINLRDVRLGVESHLKVGPNAPTSGKLPKTPRANKVIDYAIEESRALGHDRPGTGHLLLGLLREQDGVAGQVLDGFGVRLETVREKVAVLMVAEEAKIKAEETAKRATTAVPRDPLERVRKIIGLASEVDINLTCCLVPHYSCSRLLLACMLACVRPGDNRPKIDSRRLAEMILMALADPELAQYDK